LTALRVGDEGALPESVAERLRAAFGRQISAQEAVAQIVDDVRREGDAALRDYTRRIEAVPPQTLSVDTAEVEAAYHAAPRDLLHALHRAADRIRAFHQREPRGSWLEWDGEGGALGQVVRPLRRVGIYVPGGTATYPSSLLMSAIPAQVAGVEEIIVATPPDPRGAASAAILTAAHLLGIRQVVLLGGAQAVAALSYGTETIPQVDKLVGAGGLFVTLAKKLVYGDVGIDGLYGPTETLIVADDRAHPEYVAADLLAQAEHDPLATALLITPSEGLAARVQAQVAQRLPSLARKEIITESLSSRGAILLVANLDEALTLADTYAPEHLCLLVADPWPLVGRIRNAGGIFVGEESSEALGDYVVGPSHIMPTRGTARFASPLRVADFLKVTSIFAVAPTTARRLVPAALIIARAEGLTAHAAALAAREHAPPTTERSST
jgi:histidinol dehydrogenase